MVEQGIRKGPHQPGRVLTWEGTLEAQSSIHQGGESLGFTSYLRRERYVTPGSSDGAMEIPTISGNSLRGVLRGIAADLWWDACGAPPLTLSTSHAIWSGGSLAKNSSGSPLTGANLVEVLNVCPVVEIFGTAGGGRIIDGRLSVAKLIPLCEETRPFVPDRYHNLCKRTIWEYLQIENYTRNEGKVEHFNTVKVNDTEKINTPVPADGNASGKMRYGVESFTPGTLFRFKISTRWLPERSVSFFQNVIDIFQQTGHVGGKSSVGFGEFALHLTQQPAEVNTNIWVDHLNMFTEDDIVKKVSRLS